MVQNVPIPDPDGSADQPQVARPADEFDLEQVHRFYRSQVPVGTIDSDSELSARTQQSARWYISEDSSPSEGTGPYSWERPVGEAIQAVRDMINSDEDDEDPAVDIRETMHGHIQWAERDGFIADGIRPEQVRLESITEGEVEPPPVNEVVSYLMALDRNRSD